MKILLTSGGTKVPIDEVRHVGNMSKGSFGAEIASELIKNPINHVLFLMEKNSKYPTFYSENQTERCADIQYHTFDNLEEYTDKAIQLATSTPDIIISAAAVSDYTLDKHIGKISSDGETLTLVFKKAPKVLPILKQTSPKSMVVGFKLLVGAPYEQVYKAVQKQLNNGSDFVVYNDLTEIKKGNTKRLVFDKKMNFREAGNAQELVEIIFNNYSEWILTKEKL